MLSMTDKGKYNWSAGQFWRIKKATKLRIWIWNKLDLPWRRCEKLTIRWYADSLSLIIKGDDSSVLKEKHASHTIRESETVETSADLTTLIVEETNMASKTKAKLNTKIRAIICHPCHKFSTGITENFSIEKWGITDVRWSSPPFTTQCVCKIANYVISYKMAAESKEWWLDFK
jgi:RNase P subunit RPR2